MHAATYRLSLILTAVFLFDQAEERSPALPPQPTPLANFLSGDGTDIPVVNDHTRRNAIYAVRLFLLFWFDILLPGLV